MSEHNEPANRANMPVWTVFCAAVDNFGDIGVCWRLARQLRHEYGIAVELWVDDWAALAHFLSTPSLLLSPAHTQEGVRFHHWQSPWLETTEVVQRIAGSAVIIEAFACALPRSIISAMTNTSSPPLWINLDYLSAEDWVLDCHALPSPQRMPNANGEIVALRKFFFFPGFVEGTGGLLREADVLAKHEILQSALPLTRSAFLAPYLVPDKLLDDGHCLLLSLFSYEGPQVLSLLAALAESNDPSLCLVPQGRSLDNVQTFFALEDTPAVSAVLQRGSLTLVVLPFSSQEDYDRLLSLCDFNIVRGEDSFVRAQLAARPLLWHLYPQQDSVHLPKMEAFLALYSDNSEALEILKALWRRWNQGEDCRELWHHLRPHLPALHRQARNWQQKLAGRPDLAANLVQFYRENASKPASMAPD